MTIQTVSDLNKFILLTGIRSPKLIVAKLAENKQIISFEIAKLIMSKAA